MIILEKLHEIARKIDGSKWSLPKFIVGEILPTDVVALIAGKGDEEPGEYAMMPERTLQAIAVSHELLRAEVNHLKEKLAIADSYRETRPSPSMENAFQILDGIIKTANKSKTSEEQTTVSQGSIDLLFPDSSGEK